MTRDPAKLRARYARRERRKREARDPVFLARRRAIWERYAAKPENQIKIKARSALKQAVRTGKINRRNCEVCGSKNAEAHHNDYSKPFDVKWLCKKCHVEVHQMEAAE